VCHSFGIKGFEIPLALAAMTAAPTMSHAERGQAVAQATLEAARWIEEGHCANTCAALRRAVVMFGEDDTFALDNLPDLYRLITSVALQVRRTEEARPILQSALAIRRRIMGEEL